MDDEPMTNGTLQKLIDRRLIPGPNG